MYFLVTVLIVLVSLSFPLPTAAQQAPQRDPQAVAAIEQAVVTMGGHTAVNNLRDAVATGSIEPGTNSWLKRSAIVWKDGFTGDRPEFRKEISSDGYTQIIVSGHGHPARVRPGASGAVGPWVAISNPPFHLPAVMLAQQVNNPLYSLRLIGFASVDGRATIHVQTVLAGDGITTLVSPQDWYFDAATGLPLRVEHRLPDVVDPNKYITAATGFSDFRAVGGLLVPFQITLYQRETQAGVVRLASVQFNVGLSPSEFDLATGALQ